MTTRRKWPNWLEVLRPDEVTRTRVRRAIVREARSMLAARGEGWFDAVSEWAAILSPVAAAVTLIFAGLALRQAATPTDMARADAETPLVEDLLAPAEGLPSAFAADSVPDLDIVMTVIYEPVEPR